jgi:N,N'-diacetyllegionaminate synthase
MKEKLIPVFDDPYHTFIIAEAGSNWKCGSEEEDINRAKELIETAAKCGADAVKFQTFKTDKVYVANAGKSDYLSENGVNQEINSIFDNLAMPYEMLPKLSKFCKDRNIFFMSTPFSVEDAKEIDKYVEIHKIASYEINHVRLLEFLSKTKKPILISTGASTLNEIDFAVKIITEKNKQIGLLQCTSKYPAPIKNLNLNVISLLKTRYSVPVGLSDHSINPIIGPLLAVGLGSTVIEKHFTLDRNLPGPDHSFALEPNELKLMIKSIRTADLAKGSKEKKVFEEELELRQFATRSIQAIRDISKGEILQESYNIDVLRPGKRTRGLEARFLEEVNGKKATKDTSIGEGITEYE